jgi:MYXO-CTERM domain-containing protein
MQNRTSGSGSLLLLSASLALVMALGASQAHAEFVRDTGTGVAVQAHEWGLVCGGCAVTFEVLTDVHSFTQDLSNGYAQGDGYWVGSAYANLSGNTTGLIADVQANAGSGRRIGPGTVGEFTNPNATFHAEVGSFGDISMLLTNDQATAMRYSVDVSMTGAFDVSDSLGQAVPVSVMGGATAFTFDPDPFGEGGDVIDFWSHSAVADSVMGGPAASGAFNFVIPAGGRFWLWGYAGADAASIDTSLDPNAGVSGVDGQAAAYVELRLSMAPVPEPPAASLSLAGLAVLALWRRRRRIGHVASVTLNN